MFTSELVWREGGGAGLGLPLTHLSRDRERAAMTQYTPILALLILAVLFAGLSFFASGLMAPRRPTEAK